MIWLIFKFRTSSHTVFFNIRRLTNENTSTQKKTTEKFAPLLAPFPPIWVGPMTAFWHKPKNRSIIIWPAKCSTWTLISTVRQPVSRVTVQKRRPWSTRKTPCIRKSISWKLRRSISQETFWRRSDKNRWHSSRNDRATIGFFLIFLLVRVLCLEIRFDIIWMDEGFWKIEW